jgi:NADH-quinone oxidoreductase subunit M
MNFASETMVFFGAFKPGVSDALTGGFKIATGFALWGVVISAVYMLRAYKRIFLGEPAGRTLALTDTIGSSRWPIILLIATLMITGFAPRTLLNYVKPSVQALLPAK